MSTIPLFVWPLGPVINTEPVRYVVNKVDHDRVVDTLREQNRVLRCALESIAKNTCCAPCREAALVAQAALTATSQPAPPNQGGPSVSCNIANCFTCKDATSQEGQG